ncbi:hypothetical protein RJT34_15047 [Clitoria ternatea]|uniref:BED-type domain-containing protein n=1 Tax=Clitoria ternatea TaxID=43366 RepID=A0AAN9JRU7_CLITE
MVVRVAAVNGEGRRGLLELLLSLDRIAGVPAVTREGCRSFGAHVLSRLRPMTLTVPRHLLDHGIAQDEQKKKVRCNYCGKIVRGGIYRLKQHLARVSGEVTYCEKAPEEVYLKMKENLEGCRSNKKQKQIDPQAYMNFHSNDDEDDEEQVGCRSKGKQLMDDRNVSVNLTPLRSLGYVDPGWEHGIAQDERKKKVKCNYCEKVVSGGINRFKQHLARIPGEVAPCKNAPEDVYLKIKENMKWHRTGRRLRRPEAKELMPFYAKSDNDDDEYEQVEDALHHMNKETFIDVDKRFSKDLMKIFRGMSSSTGPEPVLRRSRFDNVYLKLPKNQTPETYKQVVTENTLTYKAAGKMLEEKRRNLFWTPCATYCINRMLEDVLKIRCVEECMEKGQKITKLIYNQTWLLNLMKSEFTQGQELLKPVGTRYASSFATLQSLLDHRVGLRRMFLSNKWISSRFSSSNEGKEVEKIVLNVTFWKKMRYVKKSVDPIMQVLQKVYSGESLSMPHIYNDMYRAKLAIKSVHGDDTRKYEPFWKAIDSHWNSLFCHPLYLAAYFLNPSYRYCTDFVAHSEVVRGLNECIVRLEPDNMRRISASMQISHYNSAQDDFGTELAISTRTGLEPEHLLDDWIVDANVLSSDVDKSILFGVELDDDEYENDSIDFEDGAARPLKGSLELVTMADIAIGSPDVDHANIDAATDDESDLNYFDDYLSE